MWLFLKSLGDLVERRSILVCRYTLMIHQGILLMILSIL